MLAIWVVLIGTAGAIAVASPVARQQRNAVNQTTPEPSLVDWHTGSGLDQFAQTPISVSWTRAPFRERLREFSIGQRVAVFVDRRVDPGTLVTLDIQHQTIEQFLWALAKECDIGVCRIGDIYYFGPATIVEALPSMWQKLESESANQARHHTAWPDLTPPAKLISELETIGKVGVAGKARVTHDLWAAGDLPPLPTLQQVALISIGFNAWPQSVDANNIRLVDFDPPLSGTVRYPLTLEKSASPAKLKRDLKSHFRDCKFRVTRDQVVTTGATSSLHQIAEFLVQRNQIEAPKPEDMRFTLKTIATREQILRTVVLQTGRQLKFDARWQAILSEEIQIECQQQSIEALIKMILKGTALQAKVSEKTLELSRQ